MFRESNKIIMIDDKNEDLEGLSNVFIKNGIGCRIFQYDPFYNEPLTGIRIAFMDINLNSANSDQQRNSTLVDTIKRYISEENGLYVLVFWTNKIEWIENFTKYVNEREDTELAKRSPFHITCVDKADFYDSSQKLEAKIKSIFNSHIVSILFEYEDLIADSAYKAMSSIINIIPKSDKWGDNNVFESGCQSVFSAIAAQTAGYAFAKENPDKAIKEAMIPIISDSFVSEQNTIWKSNLPMLEESKSMSNICFPTDFKESKLNSIFNIEYGRDIPQEARGAICPILDKDKLFEDKFNNKFCDWFSQTFPDVSKPERNDSELICVEFSAACDFSQKKKRTNKYLLGAILPISVMDKIANSDKKGDYLLLLTNKFDINGTERVIGFNLNFSFTISKSAKDKYLGEPIFCFKKEMMDHIGHKYANHISRIGITTFI